MTAGSAPDRVNLHATVVVAGAAGVMILGPSGAGKSALALAVIEHFRLRGRFAALVADDGVWVSLAAGRLVAEAPPAIAGLAEIRGLGPVGRDHEPRALVDRAVRLVPRAEAPRMAAAGATHPVLGRALPCLDLAMGDTAGALLALAAWLEADDTGPL